MWKRENEHFVRDFLQFWHFDAIKNDAFCSFHHSYCDVRGKPQRHKRRHVEASKRAFRTRLPPILNTLTRSKTTRFAASTIVTATSEESHRDTRGDMWKRQNEHFVRDFLQFWHFDTIKNDAFCSFHHSYCDVRGKPQRHKRRHVEASKRAFRTRLPPILTLWHDRKTTRFAASTIVTASEESHRDTRGDMWKRENEHFVRDFLQFWHFDTIKNDAFCSFHHSYCERQRKATETQEETCGSVKTSISYETSSNFDTLTRSKTTRFAASTIVTATSEESHRDTRGDMWKRQNEHFVRDFLQFWDFDTIKNDAFCSFHHSYCDVRGEARTRQDDASCNFSHRHGITATMRRRMRRECDEDDDTNNATRTQVQPPDPHL